MKNPLLRLPHLPYMPWCGTRQPKALHRMVRQKQSLKLLKIIFPGTKRRSGAGHNERRAHDCGRMVTKPKRGVRSRQKKKKRRRWEGGNKISRAATTPMSGPGPPSDGWTKNDQTGKQDTGMTKRWHREREEPAGRGGWGGWVWWGVLAVGAPASPHSCPWQPLLPIRSVVKQARKKKKGKSSARPKRKNSLQSSGMGKRGKRGGKMIGWRKRQKKRTIYGVKWVSDFPAHGHHGGRPR